MPKPPPASRLLLVALLVVAAAVATTRDSGAIDPPTESAQVLMPFDGNWANDFNTAPWEHARSFAEDWTMDVFAPATDVHARIGNTTGELRIEIAPPEPYGCSNAGQMVWVTVFVDDQQLGRFGYHHLTDIEHPVGATFTGRHDVRIGRTTGHPQLWGGGCWNVSTPGGVHAHLVLDQALGFSCYVGYTKGEALTRDAVVAVLGGASGVSWGAGPRARCGAEALDAGTAPPDDADPVLLRQDPPHLFRTLAPDHFVNDVQVATHPRSGEGLVGWHEYDENAGREVSYVQRLAPDGAPIGESIVVPASTTEGAVRFDDVVARLDADGWVAVHDDSDAGGLYGQRLVLRQLGADGRAQGPGAPVDDQPSFVGRVARDPSTNEIVVGWTRPLAAGFQVMVARFDPAGFVRNGEPQVVQTGEPGEGLGVEDLVLDPVTGSLYVFTQSGLVAGDGLLAIERNVIRVTPGGNSVRYRVDQPDGTSFTQSHGAVDNSGTLLLATQLAAVDGSMSTIYEIWEPGSAQPASVPGPASTERPTVLAKPGGGFDIVHTASGQPDVVAVTARSTDGSFAPPVSLSPSLHDRATLGDMRADRTLDGSVMLVTRNRLDGLVRLASREVRIDLPASPPTAVRNVRAVADAVPAVTAASAPGARLTVTWDPPASLGGSPITSYVVTAEPSGVQVTVAGDTTTVRVAGLIGDTDHDITVVAENSSGTGSASDIVEVFVPVRPLEGYWMLQVDGTVHGFGDADHHGDAPTSAAVALVPLHGGEGYWVLDESGVVHTFGTASHLGDVATAGTPLAPDEVAASMSATPGGDGYWIFTTRGRAIAFGAADHHGDVAHLDLNGPIVDSVATPTGLGYYQIGSDGGIFASGDATFNGSIQTVVNALSPGTAAVDWLSSPIVGLVPNPGGSGYWLVGGDGGTFSFGAPFRGSVPQVLGNLALNAPVNGMVAYGNGYLMVASDGGVFTFSDREFLGSLGAVELSSPVVAIAPISG